MGKQFKNYEYIEVTNGFNGRLIYRNSRTGELFEWEKLGDKVDIQFIDLKNAKSSAKRFFEENWFMFEDPDVIEALGLKKYYENSISVEEIEGLFDKAQLDVIEEIKQLPEGQKATLRYKAREKVANKEIDSLKYIEALEKALDIKLINDNTDDEIVAKL